MIFTRVHTCTVFYKFDLDMTRSLLPILFVY